MESSEREKNTDLFQITFTKQEVAIILSGVLVVRYVVNQNTLMLVDELNHIKIGPRSNVFSVADVEELIKKLCLTEEAMMKAYAKEKE